RCAVPRRGAGPHEPGGKDRVQIGGHRARGSRRRDPRLRERCRTTIGRTRRHRMAQGKRRFVDLSIFLENDVASDPPGLEPRIDYITHDTSVEQIAKFFPGLAPGDLPDGEGWAVERVRLSTHNGTHLDAPYHFHSTMDQALGERRPSTTIDEVPLEWCFQPRSEEHTSELQSRENLVCRLLLEKKKKKTSKIARRR